MTAGAVARERRARFASPPLELWGGIECSLVRVGDDFRNQVEETGHRARLSDIDAMASLGIKAVRYPILWESIAPEDPEALDFSWHDERLKRLRDHGIRVIAGLLHHGSGPRFTELLDPNFPKLFADYARRVAERYPWIDLWTPINEPLTTARMSFLYGLWYPHHRDRGESLRALVNQCVAIDDAMRAVREINPDAKLLATEDVSKTFATEPLAYQAAHENHRRWLTFDLLAGRVSPGHYYYDDMVANGVPESALEQLAAGGAVPDLLGFDHYLTSERYLDHRVGRYPDESVGGNGTDTYVDVEAVRIAGLRNQVGPGKRLRELWERYRLPIAVTEVHHGCTREEQLRWLHEVWTAAERERARGADIRAITLWALFGVVDWRSLLTRREGIIEPGAFDIRSPTPRPTLVAKAAARLGSGTGMDHPVLNQPGWWRRPGRTYARRNFATLPKRPAHRGAPVLITGAGGTLGQAFARICSHRGLVHVITGRDQLDITSEASIAAAIARYRPWAVINAAGFVRIDEAERRPDECFRANVTGAERLARACKLHGLPFVTFSSDHVFDGSLGRSYLEPDPTAPATVYGRSKAEADARVIGVGADTLIIRTSNFFGPWDERSFAYRSIAAGRQGRPVQASDTSIVSPTYVPDLVHASLDLLLDEEKGIWHLTNEGALSWLDFARELFAQAAVDPKRLLPANDSDRRNTSLSSQRGLLLRPLDKAIEDFVAWSEPLRALG
jgi:dTDP-4-dehydrorhamnose reductase